MEPDLDRIRAVNRRERMAIKAVVCRAFETLHRYRRLSYNYAPENLMCGSKRRTSAVCDRVNGMPTVMRRTLPR